MRMDDLGFLDPRNVGQTEYDAIWQCVNDVLATAEMEDDGDGAPPDLRALAISTLDELISVCNSMKEV